jgi:hypothetical protein
MMEMVRPTPTKAPPAVERTLVDGAYGVWCVWWMVDDEYGVYGEYGVWYMMSMVCMSV